MSTPIFENQKAHDWFDAEVAAAKTWYAACDAWVMDENEFTTKAKHAAKLSYDLIRKLHDAHYGINRDDIILDSLREVPELTGDCRG